MKVSSVYTAGENRSSSGRSFGTNQISITPAGSITDPVITEITPDRVTIQDGPAFVLRPETLPEGAMLSDALAIKQASEKTLEKAGAAFGKVADFAAGTITGAADRAKSKLILIGAGLMLLLILRR